MIQLLDLRFTYPDSTFSLAIDSLSIAAGETVAVVGPSGSGKTTLLNLIAGVALPVSGEVRLGEQSISNFAEAARRSYRIRHIGMVFQGFELLDYLNVLDNILLPLRIGGGLSVSADTRSRAVSLAQQVGIADKLERYPEQLSQGERQRVAVSRSLLLKPSLVLADEPTGNLDPANKGLVLNLLLDCVAETGATLLTVTHDRELLSRFDRVLDIMDINNWSGTAR